MDRYDKGEATMDPVARAIAGSAPVLDERTRMAMRERVMIRVTSDAFMRRSRMVFRRAMATATIAATLTGGVSYAAAVSLPGDPLYGLKRVSEELTLQLLPDGDLRQGFLFAVATRRADEFARLSDDGADDALMSQTLEQFRLTTTAAFGDVAGEQEPTPSETRLREHIEDTAEPTKEQLEAALQTARPQPVESPGAPDDAGAMEGTDDQSPEPTQSEGGTPSADATGPLSPGRSE